MTFFRTLLASAIKLPVERIEADVPLEHYGIDSILVVEMTKELEKVFGSLVKNPVLRIPKHRAAHRLFPQSPPEKLQELLGMPPQAPVARAEAPAWQQPDVAAPG